MNPLDLLLSFEPDRWRELREHRPVLIHLVEGYMDAGGVGRGLSQHLMDTCAPERVVAFDHDQVHDYRSRRPQLTFDTDRWVALTDFELALYRMTDAHGRVFLLLRGPEPDTQWNRVAAAVLDLARHMGVERFVTVQGIPMGVPHTRPVLVTTSTTDPDAAPDNPVWIDHIEIPGGFSAVLEFRAGQAGFLGEGFVAHVPHYLAQGTYAPGILAVLERVVAATGLELAIGDLAAQSLATQKALGEEVASDGELAPLVHALETQYDDLQASGRPSVPTAEEIGQVVEQFLADQNPPDRKEE